MMFVYRLRKAPNSGGKFHYAVMNSPVFLYILYDWFACRAFAESNIIALIINYSRIKGHKHHKNQTLIRQNGWYTTMVTLTQNVKIMHENKNVFGRLLTGNFMV